MILIGALAASSLPSMYVLLIALFVMAAGMGAGNGSVFQLLPLRFPHAKAITSGIVGEFGSLGGAFIPLIMGWSMQYIGNYSLGFVIYGLTAIVALFILLVVKRNWTTSLVVEGGKALPETIEYSGELS